MCVCVCQRDTCDPYISIKWGSVVCMVMEKQTQFPKVQLGMNDLSHNETRGCMCACVIVHFYVSICVHIHVLRCTLCLCIGLHFFMVVYLIFLKIVFYIPGPRYIFLSVFFSSQRLTYYFIHTVYSNHNNTTLLTAHHNFSCILHSSLTQHCMQS